MGYLTILMQMRLLSKKACRTQKCFLGTTCQGSWQSRTYSGLNRAPIDDNFISMHKEFSPSIFPRRLSKDYHSSPKPREKRASVHKDSYIYESHHTRNSDFSQSLSHRPNPEQSSLSQVVYKHEPTQRLDRHVAEERRQLISHPTRVSQDTPQWWKSTYHYFKRDEREQSKKSTLDPFKSIEGEKEYDIFNRKRESYMSIQNSRMESVYKNQSYCDPRRPSEDRGSRDFVRGARKDAVADKIGCLPQRDYSIRKPLLKIGARSYVDTYSVF